MGSIADKLVYLNGTKDAIKTAIEAKGVTIAPEDTFRDFATRVSEIPSGSASEWPRPADWPDISEVNNNEINLLVGDFGLATMSFIVTTQGAVQYTVNWGDGATENFDSGATAQHTYTVGTGTTCSLGYSTFKAVVSCSGGNILTWKVERHSLANQNQYLPLLEFVAGTINLSNCADMFCISSCYCYALASVTLPTSLNAVTSMINMFSYCYSLVSVTLPTSLNAVTDIRNMFYYCYSLASVTFPTSLNNVTNMSNIFYYCYSLVSVTLPTSLNSVTNTSNMFLSCYSLASVTLPTSLNAVTNMISMFAYCYSLKIVINIENIGSKTMAVNAADITKTDEQLTSLSFDAFLSKLGVQGLSEKLNKLSSLRLTNANSTFTGTSPHIDCSYCDLSQAALVTLFGDLPTLVGKTINITGCTGAAALTAGERAIATDKGWTITG